MRLLFPRWIVPAWLLALPLLMAPKCFDPPDQLGDRDASVGDAAAGGGDGGAGGEGGTTPGEGGMTMNGFSPAVPCGQPGEARLRVIDFSYQVACGCREATGKLCSIPRGTRVIWQFADAEEHNVASEGASFGASGERLTGTFAHTFLAPGRYLYGCTIHTEMAGYVIVVE